MVDSFEPRNEQGVIVSFIQQIADTRWSVERISTKFPDAVIRDGKSGVLYSVEFEYVASNFVKHGHDIDQCDVVICWIDDWPTCPITIWPMSNWIDKEVTGKTHIERVRVLQQRTNKMQETINLQKVELSLARQEVSELRMSIVELANQIETYNLDPGKREPQYMPEEIALAIMSAEKGEGRDLYRKRFANRPPGGARSSRLVKLGRIIHSRLQGASIEEVS